MALYNPVRGFVADGNAVSYDGRQKTTSISPMPPVAYENRFDYSRGERDMRFAGWYYLQISLNPEMGGTFGEKPYGLTVQVHVSGTPKSGPAYAGDPGIFEVSDQDLGAASDGLSGTEAVDSGALRLLAAGGIGAGTVLVLGLGVWTLVARRGGGGPPGPGGAGASQGPGASQLPGGSEGPGGHEGPGGPRGPGPYGNPPAW